jgi:hydrogenase maturation protein HypF
MAQPNTSIIDGSIQRMSVIIRGAVQGVGFRPFVYRLAHEFRLTGWVLNSAEGVFIEAEGPAPSLELFRERLTGDIPPRSFIQSCEVSYLDPAGYARFEIRESRSGGTVNAVVLPDIATCPDCLADFSDPANRRYRYPFTNCTNCGPRYSIITSLPYDRPNTTMTGFPMCPDCLAEYGDPADRRFHAQPNACPVCGPRIETWNSEGRVIASDHNALLKVCEFIRDGAVVAVKGIGGFHLMADARNEKAVMLLRSRKHREEKPFALLFPDLASARKECAVDAAAERILLSPEAPIVLLRRNGAAERCVTQSVAPGNPNLGIMLPSNPLHHLMMRELGFPVVATSGNISDEPICTNNREALIRLHGLADAFLVHNRPIRRHIDDSIVRIIDGKEMVVRRARGFAPLPLPLANASNRSILAVGSHLKNSIALTAGGNVVVSQHIGDLETSEAFEAFRSIITGLTELYAVSPTEVACDLHPDYLSSKHAHGMNISCTPVQHHYAHVAACMAENRLDGEVLGVAWDGTGLGPDGTIWGGEFLITDRTSYRRAGTLRHFRLPGGDKAVREPRRTALGVLYELCGESLFARNDLLPVRTLTTDERRTFQQMLARGLNAPVTSSAGRLFDAVASIIGLRHRVSFEGQAAMELENMTSAAGTTEAYPLRIIRRPGMSDTDRGQIIVLDWEPLVTAILEDLASSTDRALISARFHNALAEGILIVAREAAIERVVLSGGCFQNVYLSNLTIAKLRRDGFRPYRHQRIPPNDGGIALGQIAALLRAGVPADIIEEGVNHVPRSSR